jgi:hypothetical protein
MSGAQILVFNDSPTDKDQISNKSSMYMLC